MAVSDDAPICQSNLMLGVLLGFHRLPLVELPVPVAVTLRFRCCSRFHWRRRFRSTARGGAGLVWLPVVVVEIVWVMLPARCQTWIRYCWPSRCRFPWQTACRIGYRCQTRIPCWWLVPDVVRVSAR